MAGRWPFQGARRIPRGGVTGSRRGVLWASQSPCLTSGFGEGSFVLAPLRSCLAVGPASPANKSVLPFFWLQQFLEPGGVARGAEPVGVVEMVPSNVEGEGIEGANSVPQASQGGTSWQTPKRCGRIKAKAEGRESRDQGWVRREDLRVRERQDRLCNSSKCQVAVRRTGVWPVGRSEGRPMLASWL